MNSLEACGILEQLNHFPKGAAALKDLMRTMDKYLTERQIGELVVKMKSFDIWPGPATFEAECRSIAGIQSGALAEYRSPEAPAVVCAVCQDGGYLNAQGVYQRCHACENGQEFPEDLLRQLNGRTERARGPRPLEQAAKSAEFARVLERIATGQNAKPE